MNELLRHLAAEGGTGDTIYELQTDGTTDVGIARFIEDSEGRRSMSRCSHGTVGPAEWTRAAEEDA